MKILTKIEQEVDIDPKQVLRNLLSSAKQGDEGASVREVNGVYMMEVSVDAGNHSYFTDVEISKEKYNYIKNIEGVLNFLEFN